MFISLDLETTGFDATKDKIIEFGAIKFDLNGDKETLQFFVNPGFTIPQIITHITKITDNDLKDAPRFEEKIEEIKNFIGDLPIVGHNIQFDTNFLTNNGVKITNLEYDTQELSSILLPNMPSYSLEILSKSLDLQHKEKHRALDDAIATMELFRKLLKKFQTLNPDLIKRIQDLCQKSDWPLKEVIQTLKPAEKQQSETETPKTPKGKSAKVKVTEQPKPEPIQPIYKKILEEENPTLFEKIPPYANLIKYLANNASPDTYISLPHELFRELEREIPDNIGKIDTAKSYISLKRLKEFEEKPHFEKHELTALLKYIIWSKQTETGLLSEVALFNQEKTTIQKVNIDKNISNPEKEHFFKKALEKDEKNASICSHQYILENPLKNGDLIIIDFDKFIESLHRHLSIYLKPEFLMIPLQSIQELAPGNQTAQTLTSKSIILFGIIGMIFEKSNDQNPFMARSTINGNILSSKEWLDAQKITQNLIKISKEFGEINNEKTYGYLQHWKEILRSLHNIFITPRIEENLIWIEKDFQKNIVIRKMPFTTKDGLEEILNNCKNYKIISENIDLSDNGHFAKTLAGLESSLPISKQSGKSENLEIRITKDINESDKNQIPNFLIEHFQKTNGRTAMIFNSRKQLEFFTLKLSQANIPIISNLTASIGKIKELFKQDQGKSILLTLPHTWDKLGNYELIDTLFIHKIPFDPPSDPQLLAQSQNFKDPFNELQIPRAIFALKKMLNRLRIDQKTNKQAIILDSRLITKGYGDNFIKNLEEIAPTKTISLKSL